MVKRSGDRASESALFQKFLDSPPILQLIQTHQSKFLPNFERATGVISKDLHDIKQKLKDDNSSIGNPIRLCQVRTKQTDKVLKKLYQTIKRKHGVAGVKNLKKAMVWEAYENMHDKAGARVCILFVDLVQPIVERLRMEFGEYRKYDLKTGLKDKDYLAGDELGYRGYHFYVKVPLFGKKFAKTMFQLVEVQVRTLCQHAWANVSHDLIYKNMEIPPNEFTPRIIHDMRKTSTILDAVDCQFVSIRDRVIRTLKSRGVKA